VEYEYTIIRINTQQNILVLKVFVNPVSVFVLLEFRTYMHSNSFFLPLLFNEVIGELPSCFMNLLLEYFFVCI